MVCLGPGTAINHHQNAFVQHLVILLTRIMSTPSIGTLRESSGVWMEPMFELYEKVTRRPPPLTQENKSDSIPEDTIRNGVYHFPSHPARIQLGIWDASSPSGTSAWAKGPVDWKTAPSSMSAMVKSIRIDC